MPTVKELVAHLLLHVNAEAATSDASQLAIQTWVGKGREDG